MLTPCRVGSAVTGTARGIDGGPRRFTDVVLGVRGHPRFLGARKWVAPYAPGLTRWASANEPKFVRFPHSVPHSLERELRPKDRALPRAGLLRPFQVLSRA